MPDDARPYPKSSQLARGDRRYRRKVASPKQWQAIIAAKLGSCRVCVTPPLNGGPGLDPHVHMHHLVPRVRGGDDAADNIVPLCGRCHDTVTQNYPPALRKLAESLTEAEYAYVIGKLGEGGIERLFGVGSR